MLSYLRLKNFKSFKNILIDFRGKNKQPKKLIFIYGENGAGKTNIIEALSFLKNISRTIINQDISLQMSKLDLPDEAREELIVDWLRSIAPQTKDLFDKYVMIGAKEAMELEIGFYLKHKEGRYIISIDNQGICEEELYYVIKNRTGKLFSLKRGEKIDFSPSIFRSDSYRSSITDSVERYWGKHSFIGILLYEMDTNNNDFMENNLGEGLLSFISWFDNYSVSTSGIRGSRGFISSSLGIDIDEMIRGRISEDKADRIDILEKMLDSFFTSLYSDIKKVFYKRKVEKKAVKYELYVQKQVYAELKEINFSLESDGTRKLLQIFYLLISSFFENGYTVFIDEIDSGIHDVLVRDMIESIKISLDEVQEAQIIATTHNTLLMEELPNESIYIISSNIKGEKEVRNLGQYEFRTQRNHSKHRKYLSGAYDGIPNIGYLDFMDIIHEIKDLEDLEVLEREVD